MEEVLEPHSHPLLPKCLIQTTVWSVLFQTRPCCPAGVYCSKSEVRSSIQCCGAEKLWHFLCRLDSVQVVLQGGLEDPLDKEEELQDQMDSLPYLCRFQYDDTCTYICGILDPVIEAFSSCTSPNFDIFDRLSTQSAFANFFSRSYVAKCSIRSVQNHAQLATSLSTHMGKLTLEFPWQSLSQSSCNDQPKEGRPSHRTVLEAD